MKTYPYAIIINGEIIPANTPITEDTKEVKANADSSTSGRTRTRAKTS